MNCKQIGITVFVIALLVMGMYGIYDLQNRPESESEEEASSSSQIQDSLFEYSDGDFVEIEINNQEFLVEIAKSNTAKANGLMNRAELEAGRGMLFLFESEEGRSFWMKDTFVSLDIYFLDKNLKVMSIASDTQINQTDETYNSGEKAQYVVELRAETSEKFNIHVGDSFTLK